MTPALMLVDGHNLLWRAAFGFPAKVTARDGTDRTAVFAFFALLRVALRELGQPVECLVCFDGQFGACWRQQTDQSYKHNRQAIDLSPLAGLADVQRGLSMLGLAWIELEHEEADDVIASLVRLDPQRPTYILSTDRDYLQLVTEQVRVLNTAMRSGQRLLGRVEVLSRYGVYPWQWCDFRALTGDRADSIAGVPGVGAKTAARLLAGGATLETLRDCDRLGGRIGQRIIECWDQVLAWRDLIRLRDTVELPCQPAGAETKPLPPPAGILEELKLW
jgi:DNA polymerase I